MVALGRNKHVLAMLKAAERIDSESSIEHTCDQNFLDVSLSYIEAYSSAVWSITLCGNSELVGPLCPHP